MADDSRGAAGRTARWLRAAPDTAVIVAWAAVVGCMAAARASYLGDGLRHLGPILTQSRPVIGEPRWLLFPAFLFAVIKPLQVIGIVTSPRDAVHVFTALDFIAGVAYLFLIKRWLTARGAAPTARAAALLLAGMTVPLLRYSTDTIEPLIPATIALAGIVYLASRPALDRDRGLLGAGAAIALATLLYQGLFLAVALIPCAAGRGARFRARTIAIFCAILALAPATMFATMVATGNSSPRAAIHRVLTGEENSLYRRSMWHRVEGWPSWMPYVAAVSVGPARSIVMTRQSEGIVRDLRMLASRATFADGVSGLSGIIFAMALVATGLAMVLRRREWQMLIAIAGILVLPILRPFGFSYLKFYVLMPAVVAVIATGAPPAAVFGAGVIVGAFNLTNLARETAGDRRLARDIAPLYSGAGAAACWLTAGWGPPIFGWPGSECSIRQVLTQAHTERLEDMIAENNLQLIASLRRCFCESSAVYTNDVAEDSREQLFALAREYRFDGFELNGLIWNRERGELAFDRDGIRIYRYSGDAQSQICASLQAAGG
ncbi:MAG TPA: hypothetical protein VEU51_01120 [Candidatus Acidoferrales bacterium]|nr:hypothetical protein [Candidatus Acidoferrales bacterium]